MRLVVLPGGDLLASARAIDGESLVIILPSSLGSAEAKLARASIELLAVERAPRGRVNAVLPRPAAEPADVEAAIGFLDRATSTTGQLIELN